MNPHATDDEYRDAARADQAAMELRETEAAFDQTRAGLLEVIATSKFGEQELREKCFLAVQALDRVRSILVQVAASKAVVEHNVMIRAIMAGEDPA